MATYTELYNLHNNSAIINRVAVACIVAAESIVNEDDQTPNHASRLIWAAACLKNPRQKAVPMYWALLAANAAQTVENIEGASDVIIQNQVDAHVDLFATG